MLQLAVRFRETALVLIALGGLAVGGALVWLGHSGPAGIVWSVATLPVLAALLVEIVQALRRADIGLDLVAALSMSAALAFGEPLAANVVGLMYAGGQLLEQFAEGRAKREMTALLGRVARTAMVERAGTLVETPIEAIVPGDIVMIRRGEVLPVDGTVADGDAALLDPAAITGESLPRNVLGGGEVPSGATSAGNVFRLVASRRASESTYARIVRLVEAAQESKGPMTRLADRYAIGFLALTLALAGGAWALSGDHLRALAVLVCATPCPLILAVPVAIISGISRAAKAGVLVKDGGVFEALARVKVAILDKTGTLTHGNAAIGDIRLAPGQDADEVLRLAASLDQASGHPMAAMLVTAARDRGLVLEPPLNVSEQPGSGIAGDVGGSAVAVGGDRFIGELTGDNPFAIHPSHPASATIAVAVGGRLAGVIVIEDQMRGDARSVIGSLRAAGIVKVVLASGDRQEIVDAIGPVSGADEWLADMSAGDKVDVVNRERVLGPVMMVGDGVNDAPALAAADVGVAMGAQGATVSSETAGVVVLVDALEPLVAAMTTARRSIAIALQSVWVGLGLSIAAMVVAAFGYLPPVQGALVQEAIDVAVILNALRALR